MRYLVFFLLFVIWGCSQDYVPNYELRTESTVNLNVRDRSTDQIIGTFPKGSPVHIKINHFQNPKNGFYFIDYYGQHAKVAKKFIRVVPSYHVWTLYDIPKKMSSTCTTKFDLNLWHYPDAIGPKICRIPKGTIVDLKGYEFSLKESSSLNNRSVYVNYNGQKGWLVDASKKIVPNGQIISSSPNRTYFSLDYNIKIGVLFSNLIKINLSDYLFYVLFGLGILAIYLNKWLQPYLYRDNLNRYYFYPVIIWGSIAGFLSHFNVMDFTSCFYGANLFSGRQNLFVFVFIVPLIVLITYTIYLLFAKKDYRKVLLMGLFTIPALWLASFVFASILIGGITGVWAWVTSSFWTIVLSCFVGFFMLMGILGALGDSDSSSSSYSSSQNNNSEREEYDDGYLPYEFNNTRYVLRDVGQGYYKDRSGDRYTVINGNGEYLLRNTGWNEWDDHLGGHWKEDGYGQFYKED